MTKALTLALLLASHAAVADGGAPVPCDRLRSPLDGNANPVHYHPDAILPALRDACLQALDNDPQSPRLLYQTGVAYWLLAQNAHLAHNSQAHTANRLRDYGLVQSTRAYLQRAADGGYFPARLMLADFSFNKDHEQNKAALEALLAGVSGKEAAAVHLQLGHWHALQARFQRDNAEAHRKAMRAHYQQALDLGSREAHIALARSDTNLAASVETLRELAAEGNLLALQSLGEGQLASKDAAGLAQTVAELQRLGQDNPDYRITARYLEGMALLDDAQSEAKKAQGLQYLQEAAAGGHGMAKTLVTFSLPPQP